MNVMMALHYRDSRNRNTVFAFPPWILALLMWMLMRLLIPKHLVSYVKTAEIVKPVMLRKNSIAMYVTMASHYSRSKTKNMVIVLLIWMLTSISQMLSVHAKIVNNVNYVMLMHLPIVISVMKDLH
jgi:hypothetical protein